MSEEQKPQLSEAECTPRSNPEMEDEKLWFYKDGNTSKQEDNLLVSTEDDENSDSDTDDNVKIIIGHIQTNPSMYMEMLTNLNSQPDQEASTS
uniref:Uncharacterized protein n=1 Tax=Jaculus jaculus TaxID=51337 RepID=A0A8C5KJW4_JACJA